MGDVSRRFWRGIRIAAASVLTQLPYTRTTSLWLDWLLDRELRG